MAADINRHEVLLFASGLAYTTALTLAPFMVIMLSVAALLGQDLQTKLYSEMTALMGEQAGSAVKMVVENADNRPDLAGFSGILGFLVLAASASAIFSQLRTALDRLNERDSTKDASGVVAFFKEKVFSVGLVFGFAFLSVASLTLTTVFAVMLKGSQGALWETLSFVINFALFTGLFTLMFRYIPSDRLGWWRAGISGVMGAVFFLVGKTLIGLYLGKAGAGAGYGAASSLVVFLIWVYYNSVTLLISYEFTNHIIFRHPVRTR